MSAKFLSFSLRKRDGKMNGKNSATITAFNVLVKFFLSPVGLANVMSEGIALHVISHPLNPLHPGFLPHKRQIKKLCKNKKKKIKLSKMGFSFTPARHWATKEIPFMKVSCRVAVIAWGRRFFVWMKYVRKMKILFLTNLTTYSWGFKLQWTWEWLSDCQCQ